MVAHGPFQLERREVFERNLVFAVVAGLLAGAVQVALTAVGAVFSSTPPALFPAPQAAQVVPLALLCLVAVGISHARGDLLDRALIGLLAVVLPAIPYLFRMAHVWQIGLAGAAVGPLMVRAHLCDRGASGLVGARRPGLPSYLLASAVTAVLAAAGVAVMRIIAGHLLASGAPGVLAAVASGAGIALFVGLGAMAAHLALDPDPASARLSPLLARASGDAQRLVSRALHLYGECSKLLGGLGREPVREALAEGLTALACRTADLAQGYTDLDAVSRQVNPEQIDQELTHLAERAAGSTDPVARGQLERARKALSAERDRISDLATRRERLLGQLEANVALLGSAHLALLGARTSQAQLLPIELSGLTERIGTLLEAEGTATDAAAGLSAPERRVQETA